MLEVYYRLCGNVGNALVLLKGDTRFGDRIIIKFEIPFILTVLEVVLSDMVVDYFVFNFFVSLSGNVEAL